MFDPSTAKQTYDVIIIGGGINGASVARDAALRGLSAIVIEKNDFASGSSSWSTRLVHGGLRYLEYFEFPLVREALHDREILLRNAPHLVNPLLLTIPIYGDRSRPYWKIWAGMCLYDVFSFDKTVPEHRMLPRRKFKQLFRAIEGDGLNGGAQYYDAQASLAERLCWENLRSAIDAGAVALNYTRVTELHREGDRITRVSCCDELDGHEFEIYGHEKTIVINTSGPWVDRVCATAEIDGKSAPIGTRKMGGTKGSHIVVPPFPGAPDSALYVEAKSDGRPFFIVPWLGQYLIGTTDLPFEGSLDRIKADNDEIDYLLNETNSIVPGAGLNRDSVLFTYSGVRPLPYAEGKNAGSITRRHILFDHTSEGVANAISLIGGKLTTHRAVGEEMVDQIFKKRGDRVPVCPTITTPLPGAILPDDPRIPVAVTQYRDRLSAETVNYLFSIYGALALEVLALVDRDPSLAAPLGGDRPDIQAQIVYAVESEAAKTIIDILRRRIPLAMLGGYGLDLLPVVANVLKTACGWSAERCDRAIAEYETFMRDNCIPDYALTRELAATSAR